MCINSSTRWHGGICDVASKDQSAGRKSMYECATGFTISMRQPRYHLIRCLCWSLISSPWPAVAPSESSKSRRSSSRLLEILSNACWRRMVSYFDEVHPLMPRIKSFAIALHSSAQASRASTSLDGEVRAIIRSYDVLFLVEGLPALIEHLVMARTW